MAYNYFEKTPVESVPAIEKEKQNATLNDGLAGDAVDSFQAGALSGMGGIFDFVGAEGIAKSLYDWSDEQQKTMSESGRESLNKQFITEDANGDIAIGEGMKDIDTWILTMANVAGQFASTAVPGGAAARAVTKVASLGKKGSKAADAIGMGATGGAAGTGQGMEQARQEIQNMPDDVLADSPMFVDVLRDIHSKNPSLSGAEKWDLAKDEISRRVAQDVRTDPKVLVTNFAASAIGDPVIGKALTGARIAKNGALGSALKGFATEGATESLQAGVQQYGINEAIQPIDNRDPMKGVVAAGLNEGLAGGAFGGLAGGAGGIVNKSQDNNNKPKNEKLDSYQKQSAEVLKSGYADMVNSGMDEAEAKEAIREQQYNAAIKKGFTEEEANVAVARTMRDMFAEYSDIADIEPEQAIPDDNVTPQFQQDDALQHDQGVDYDSPTAARKAGFAETDKAAGQFGDMLTSPAQESLRALDQGNGAPSVDERVKAAAFDKTPTPDDRFSPIKYTHEGELLGPEQQAQAPGVEKGPIDGFTVPEQGKLPTTEQTKNRQMREQAQAEIDAQAKGIEQKDIIFGEDGRPQQRAAERVKQAGKDAENLLPHKDIVFAGDQSGVNVARNGLPFKTKRDALLSKEARAARRAGQKTKAIPFDNGFGWTTKDSSLKSAPNTGPDLSAENQQTDATVTDDGSMPQQSESIEKTNEKPAANLVQPKGKRSTTYTPTGKQIETEFAVFDANDQSLVTSNDSAGNSNPNYPQHLQPRDRTRVSSLAQISEIANKIEPSRLGDSQETDRGAPIVKSGVVESGNGRVLAIRQAYKNGKAEKYKQFLIDNAEQFGLNKQDIEAMEAPILTRERLTELSQDELVNFTVDSNRQAGIERSPAELALTDASLFTDDELKLLNVPENGNILSSDNKAFLNSFANKLGNNEAAKYRQSDGTWNSQFAARVNNAIFAKAYDSPDLVSASSEATTKESANLINALVNGASKVAALKGPSDGVSVSNAFGQELAETVSSAANMIIKSRRDNLSIDDMISQQDAFTDRDEEAEALAKLLSKNIRSAKKMSAIINSIADDIDAALINAEQADIFTGETQPLPSMSEVLSNAQQRFTQDKQDTSRNMGGRSATEAQQSSQTQGMASDTSQGSRSGGENAGVTNNAETAKSSAKPKSQSKLDNAANTISDKKREAAERLKKLINSRKGQFNSGIDPEVMVAVAEVGALSIAEGAIKFAQWARDVLNTTRAVGIKDEDVKPFLKEAYGAMSANPERYNIDDSTADSMDLPRNVRKFDIDTIESESNVSTTSENVEQDSRSGDQEPEHQNANDDESNGSQQSNGPSKPNAEQEARSDSEPSVSADDGALPGAGSADDLFNEPGDVAGTENTSSAGNDGRSNSNNDVRVQAEQGPAAATSEATGRLKPESAVETTKEKTSHNAKWGDEKDILASVPVLMPEQAGDIAQIEARFFGSDNQGLGFQNTNGTGTGKTFVGLGTIKRFVQTGKSNALVVVPNDGIAQQWVKAAKEFFGLDVYLIGQDGGPKTKDAGRGITISTYATLGNNSALIKDRDKFDLVVADESQNLMGGQHAKETNALRSLRALTNHERGTYARARAFLSDKHEALEKKIDKKYRELLPLRDSADGAKEEAREFYQKERSALESETRALQEKFDKQGQFDTKVLFLSATPWPYVRNLDYSEGYLFKYTDYGDKHDGGYDNAFHGHNAFYIQNFGYQWRYHKLNKPGADVDASLMERTFNQSMKDKGVVGGRTLEVEADYKRDFIKVETAAGEKLDDLIEKWRDHEVTAEGQEFPDRPYSELAELLNALFDYTSRVKLVEAIKAEEAANRALDHVAMGRKVVLFHSYNVGGSFNPVQLVRDKVPDLMAQFDAEYPGMSDIDFGDLERPLDLFARKFGDQVRFYNGNVPDKARKEAKDLFNQDDSGVNIIVVQQEAGEAGISLHDVTGKHQRVLINIGMPVKPTQFIQIEGRTYRVGVKTDAQFENLTTGTAFERSVFASKIAGRASTAENLAMGEFARSLKENISEGYLDAAYLPAQTKIGQGGKVKDKPSAIDPWDKAISLYYSNLKRNQNTKSAEGDDYFATPEPLGKKMVEWLQPMAGHRLLEPSVGHAAIGRWFPGNTKNKATEKSYKLTSLAQMNFPGEVDNIPFEELNIINKFEGIAMNPPFGKGGKLAYEHIRKAIKHLTNGGRIIALVPDGGMADKRFNALLEDEALENIHLAADINLPAGVFKRAGTGVKTKIIVLDRFDNPDDAPNTQYVNFTGSTDVNTLFDRIKDIELKDRKQPTPVEIDTTQYMDADSPARKDRKGNDQYKIELYGYLPNDVKKIVDAEAINAYGAIPSRNEKVYYVDHPDARTDLAQFIGRTIEEAIESGVKMSFDAPKPKPKVDGETSNEYFEYSGETYTTKRGKEFLVTKMKGRQEYDTYSALKELAKDYDGWARGQSFMFSTEDDIKQFNAQAKALLDGNVSEGGSRYDGKNSEVQRRVEEEQYTFDFENNAAESAVQSDKEKNKNVVNKDVDFLTYSGQPVNTEQQAASALASIRKLANEQMTALVTDKRGNVLNIIRHSLGTNRSATVDPGVLAGSILDIDGAANVWLAHNHPTGNPKQSQADKLVTQNMLELMRGSGVDVKGMITLGESNKATFYYPGAFAGGDVEMTVPPTIRKGKAPISERRIRSRKVLGPAIGSPEQAKTQVIKSANGESGLLLLNNKNEPVEFMPMSTLAMSKLRDGKLKDILKSIHNGNITAAIASVDSDNEQSVNAVQNVASLFKHMSLTLHDAINVEQAAKGSSAASWASTGKMPNPISLFFSKSKTKKKAKGVSAKEAQTIADSFVKGLNGANGIKVRILATTAEAEQMWRMSLDGATVKGAYSEISNTVYVIAENIDSVTDLKQTLAHETIAHGGLDTVIGKEAKQEFINRIKKTKGRKAFEKYWKDANTDYWDMSDDVKAEEIFARFVENEPSKGELKYWWQALKRWIKAQLDKAGIMYREDDEVTAMRDMLESIVKGFKAQREPKIQQRSGLAYSQPGKKFSRTADEDTRTAKEKLGLVEQAKESVADIIKGKLNSVYETAKDSSFWNRLNEGIFDGLAGIKQAEEKAGITDINKQGYVSARLASGLADVLHGVYNYGAPQWKNGIVARKENTKGLLEVFGMLGDDLNNWLAWMGAHRAEKLKEDGRENNLTDADIAELKALGKGKEKLFEEVRKEYNKINSAILDLAEQAGLLNKQQRAAFDEEYYVPFFRDMGETDPEMDDIKRAIIEPHTRNGIAGQSAQIKALKGGGMSTKDLLENIITRQSTLIDASLKNKAMLEVVNNLDGTDFMKSENSEDIAALSQHDLNKLGKVKVMNGGKAQAYVVSDPALLRSLIQINSNGSQNLFRKLGRSAKRFLTAGVTLSPDFIFRNFVRDAAHAWMINKDDFKLGTDSFKGLKKAFKEDEAYRDLIFSGAAFQGGYVHGSDPEAGAQQMRRALRSKGLSNNQVDSYMRSIVDSGASLLEKYRNVSDKFENANRLSTYEAALKAGKSKRQAAFEAKDLMDYSLKGNFETIAFFVDMLPFFNARLQGMSKLVRASKANGDDQLLRVLSANLAGKGIKLAAFSLALAAMNDDDERYQKLEDWDKDANWHFFVGDGPGHHWRIPKPFELGVIFGTMPERLFHFGTGAQNEKDLGRAVVHAITSTMSMNPIPQFMLPATEVVMNKSFFKWAPIEGMADQNKQAEDRYNAYTSDTAKAIAQAFGVSPKKVEHLIKGYTGTLGAYVLGASDIVARQAMGIESAETPVSRYPVIKSFYQGSGPKSSTKFANEFYEALDTANQAYGSYKRAQELGDTSRIKELIENDGEKLSSRAKLAKIQRDISKLNKMQKAINDNNNLSSSQKREQLDNIQRKKNAIFHKAYIAYSLGEW